MEKRERQSRRTAAQMHALAAVRRDIRSDDRLSSSKYLADFSDAFCEFDAVLPLDQIEDKISGCNVLLLGDYHALAASQNFAAELVERCAKERPVVLAVEAILTRQQRVLDRWWRREIDGEQLRIALRFDKDWGYPWEPFHGLLTAARDHAEAIYGIDCIPRDDLRRIRSRDRHAAAKIREIRHKHPHALIFVVFGESHLAPQHLPRAIEQTLPGERMLTILQNIESLYWPALAQRASAVRIADDVLCIFNSSPLEKYESYRLCLERWKSSEDGTQDFTPAVYNLIFSLARALGFRLDSPRNGMQPRFLADSLPEIIVAQEAAAVLPENKSCMFLPDSNSFLITEFRIADAAEECAWFLHFACRGMTGVAESGRSLERALARFGQHLLCPELTPARDLSLASRLYRAYVEGQISLSKLRSFFRARIDTPEKAKEVIAEVENALHT